MLRMEHLRKSLLTNCIALDSQYCKFQMDIFGHKHHITIKALLVVTIVKLILKSDLFYKNLKIMYLCSKLIYHIILHKSVLFFEKCYLI